MAGKYEDKCALQDCHRIDILTKELKTKVSWKTVSIATLILTIAFKFYLNFLETKVLTVENNSIAIGILSEKTLNLNERFDYYIKHQLDINDIKTAVKEVLNENKAAK